MALERRDVPITREEAHEWLQEYSGPFSGIREYLMGKVEELNLEDNFVVTEQGDTHIVDVIIGDLGSYV